MRFEGIERGEGTPTSPLFAAARPKPAKPLTATIKREHPPAVISLCRTDHNKVPISNHHVDIILNHNLCFSDDASTGRKSIHKQHYWAISHDVNRWHISQNNFVFSDAGGGVNPDASDPIAITLRLSSGFATIGIDHLLQQRTQC